MLNGEAPGASSSRREVALPDARGRLRNAAYALQWWCFAAFTVVMAVRIARDVGRPATADVDPPSAV